MTKLGDALMALAAQGWTVWADGQDFALAFSPPARTAIALERAILDDPDAEPALHGAIDMLRGEASLIWPWPPVDRTGFVRGGEQPRVQ